MPVILEKISNPNAADLNDLIKIFQDYPADAPDPPTGNLEHWIKTKLQQQLLFAGRFNGRLLGAVWCSPQNQGWQLQQLCVRAITRRRGVARQLTTLLANHADKQQRQLLVEPSTLPEELSSLLSEHGLRAVDSSGPDTYLVISPPQLLGKK